MYSIGTEEYIRRVVEDYSPMLLRLAMTRSLSTADAEDAVQEVFLRLLTQLPRFRDGEHERAWLIRTTIHRASDLRKAASNRRDVFQFSACLVERMACCGLHLRYRMFHSGQKVVSAAGDANG